MILVTGSSGFIGSNFALDWVAMSDEPVVNLGVLTYAGNRENLALLGESSRHVFVQTNIVGTLHLLKSIRAYWVSLQDELKQSFRFLHVSTDKVYGSLTKHEVAFAETRRYEPNRPYSVSNAARDHLVRSYHYTYGMPALTTNCSNNCGPYHFPKKLIPLMVVNALAGKSLPIYGDGQQIRDWLYVKDHCSAIRRVLEAGKVREVYNIGGWDEKTNIDIVHAVCALLDEYCARAGGKSYREQIAFVTDRPGHDRRYAIDVSKVESELGWKPAETFDTGIRKTVQWYLENQSWVASVQSGAYLEWIERNYTERAA